MADYVPVPQRFVFGGIASFPPDVIPPGKFPFAVNVRSYEDGAISPRAGLAVLVNPGLGAIIHTLARLNDPTPFNGGVPALRVYGSGGNLFAGIPSDATPPLLDTGYSGNPLNTVAAQPPQSPRPYLYVADTSKLAKFTTDGSPVPWGIPQPSAPSNEPTVSVDQQTRIPFDPIISGTWIETGTGATAPVDVLRVDTVIGQILYDDPIGMTGYCSIVPTDMTNITVGTLLTVDEAGSPENSLVTDLTIAVVTTTVQQIIYDAGNTGLCTIFAAGSLGIAQLDAPILGAYRLRAGPQNEEVGPLLLPDVRTGRARQVDFPVNCIITLAGAETVRILSVAFGPDGTMSFRCKTATTINAGDSISGLPAFRIFLNNTFTSGQTLSRHAKQNQLAYGTPAPGATAKIYAGIFTNLVQNCAQFIGGMAVRPEDDVHVAVKVDRLNEVQWIRIYFDVSPLTNDFTENYYFFEWRASDIISSIQGSNTGAVSSLTDAKQTAVANSQILQNLPSHPTPDQQAAAAAAYDALSRQLALGNNQWLDLKAKVADLLRVGTNSTRTLADVRAFEIEVAAAAPAPDVVPNPLTVAYTDLNIYGGGGPDVGQVGDPYVYIYRYRSSLTGAVSNPSPASRGGVIPQRQNVFLTPTVSSDPDVDLVDWFRLGASLTRYTFIGSGPNSTTPFTDSLEDSLVDGGETIDYGNFQPWPTLDIKHSGTCKVAGTAVQRLGGDPFDTRWAPGSLIIVNDRATTLYSSPASTDLLHIVDCVGGVNSTDFRLPGPTLLAQPLGRCWGPYQGFYFACGDPVNPGTLYWTRGNNIEAANDTNTSLVTSPSEPLQNGFIYSTFPAVFTSEDLYAIISDVTTPGAFRAIKTPCGRGLWTPWAFDLAPEGVYFLSGDGIYLTQGGSPAVSTTSPDLRAIFPQDGIPGTSVNGIPAPDMTQTNRLRISYIAGYLYFDYLDLQGNPQTLVLDTVAKRWYHDHSNATGLSVRLEEPGSGVYDQIVGGANGKVYQYEDTAILDDGVDLAWEIDTPWTDGQAPRLVKQWGDVGVDYNAANSINGITALPVLQDGAITTPAVIFGTGLTGRRNAIIQLPIGGILARNLGVNFSGTLTGGDTARPFLFWWEPTFIPKTEDIAIRPTDWDNLGYQGAKFVQGIIIRANTYGQTQTLQIQKDGDVVALTIDVNHDGEQTKAYPLAAAGWLPFVSELVRIVPTNLSVDWQLLDVRWVFEPAPELATQWETQFTSNDWPGYGTVRDMVFAYEATAPFVLVFTYDDRQQTYIIPANGGNYSRFYFPFCPNKAKAVKFQWKTAEPGRIYKRDVSTRIQGWGAAGGYQVANPFGGPSRSSGAEI